MTRKLVLWGVAAQIFALSGCDSESLQQLATSQNSEAARSEEQSGSSPEQNLGSAIADTDIQSDANDELAVATSDPSAPTEAQGEQSDAEPENQDEEIGPDDQAEDIALDDPDDRPTRVIVKFRGSMPANARAALHKRFGHRLDRVISQIDAHIVRIAEGQTADDVIAKYERHPLVEFAEAETFAKPMAWPDDYQFGNQFLLHTELCNFFGDCYPETDAVRAWDITTGSAAVPIGVLDSGLDYNHFEYVERIRRGEIYGYNFENLTTDYYDTSGHGTAVSGVIAAEANNGVGIAGVNWHNPLVVMSMDAGATLFDAIFWAADNGVRVVNLSYCAFDSPMFEATIQYAYDKGVIVVSAAGNGDGGQPCYPGAYPTALSVTGVSAANETIGYNWGEWLDLSAPGRGVNTTGVGNLIGIAGGTSLATPFVAAAAGLVLSVNPDLTAQCVMDILKQTADDIGDPGFDVYTGHGRVNFYRAVQAAQTWVCDAAPDTTPPTVTIVDPPAGAVLAGLTNVTVDASDDTRVTRVDLYLDGSFVSSDTIAPHEWSLDTATLANGSHTISAVAFDAAGNRADSAPVSVTVDNALPDTTPPTVEVIDPIDGAVLFGSVTIKAEATDDNGVSQVDLYCSGSFIGSVASPPYEWGVDTTALPDGSHAFWAVGRDEAGNFGASPWILVTIDNGAPCACPADCSEPAVNELAGSTCSDGADNDCDGMVDCDDPDCAADAACDTQSPACNNNGVCEADEDCFTCGGDCMGGTGATCGNGVCETGNGEDCVSCPEDCNGKQSGKPDDRFCCGGGGGQKPVGCNDARCNGAGFACTATPVSDSCCGDGVCNGTETGCSCPVDCGSADGGEVVGSTCRDGLDNDCDGVADCDDPDCIADLQCPQCDNNGVCEAREDCRTCPADCSGQAKGRKDGRHCCGDGQLAAAEGDGSLCDGNP